MTSVSRLLVSDGRMIDKLKKDLKGSLRGLWKYYREICLEILREATRNLSK
jgi:hypothetical protein